MDYKKYLELERLVETGGDKKKIEKLRNELGLNPTSGTKMSKLTVAKYAKYKQIGVTDKQIAKELNISLSLLKRFKINNDLMNSIGRPKVVDRIIEPEFVKLLLEISAHICEHASNDEKFNPTIYKELKTKGLLDKDIAKAFKMSMTSFSRYKSKHGLVNGYNKKVVDSVAV